jgi:hypothetical protein
MANADKKNATSFKIGDKAAEKWTPEDAEAAILKVRQAAIDGARSIQGAILDAGLYSSGFDYLLEKYPNLGSYKKDIQNIIVHTINTGGLDGEYNAAMSIWRMKQLGEKDKQEIEQTTKVIKVKTS